MKDIDKELDTQIKDILNFLDEKSHQSLGYNATVQAIKQLINQARIDELSRLDRSSSEMTQSLPRKIGERLKELQEE